MKFDMENIVEALKEAKIGRDDIDAVSTKLAEIAEQLRQEKEANKVARAKKKLVLLNPKDTASYYVMQTRLDDDGSQVVANLQKAIGDYNQSAKKKKVEITNNAEALEFIPARILKDHDIVLKAKTPCEVNPV